MASTDPYAAPKSRVADAPAGSDNFISEGRAVAGGGWSWITEAWRLVRQNTGTWIGLFVVFVVIVVVLSFIPFLGALALYVLGPIFIGGIMMGCDSARNGGDMTVGHLFAGFSRNAGKLAGIGLFALIAFIAILAVVIVIFGMSVAGLFMGAGANADPAAMAAMGMTMMLAALVMLGLSVPVYMALWFAYPLVAINDFPVGQALKTSFSVCLKNILPFLVYGIAFLVLAFLATIPLGLGWLLLGPVLLASIYTSYRDAFYQS
jgi:hypothetical protein